MTFNGWNSRDPSTNRKMGNDFRNPYLFRCFGEPNFVVENLNIAMKRFSLLCCLLPWVSSAASAADPLTLRQQNIAVIAAFASSSDMERLKPALHRGLDEQLTISEIKEVLIQLYAYCGFPRSLNALGAFKSVVEERAARGIRDQAGRDAAPLPADFSAPDAGRRVQTGLVGHPVEGGVFDFAPVINHYLQSHLFGDIFARDNLDFPSRELATIGALAVVEGLESQLVSHLSVCLNVGLTPAQLQHFVVTLQTRVGEQEGRRAAQALEKVLSSMQ